KQADVNAGQVVNTATVRGDAPEGVDNPAPAEDTETVTFGDGRSASLAIDKSGILSLGDDGVLNAGDVITYTFAVFNTGNVTLTDVTVADPLADLVWVTGPSAGTLAPGATVELSATYALKQADVNAGQVVNTATVRGDAPEGVDIPAPAEDTETDTLSLRDALPISIDKSGILSLGDDGVL